MLIALALLAAAALAFTAFLGHVTYLLVVDKNHNLRSIKVY